MGKTLDLASYLDGFGLDGTLVTCRYVDNEFIEASSSDNLSLPMCSI